MDWNKLDRQIIESPRYLFFKKYERVVIAIEGLIVIGLLFGIIMYMVQDRQIKEQIRDHCGYTTDKYDCICDNNYVENWKGLKSGGKFIFNLTDNSDG